MNNTELAPRRRFGVGWVIMVVVLLVGGAGALWFATRPDPERLYQQGLAAAQHDAMAGEQLLRRAIASAGRPYPDAQIALCCLLARRGMWDEALSLFAEVDKPACRADFLLMFADEAGQAGHSPQAIEALEFVRRRGTEESLQALQLLVAIYGAFRQQEQLIDASSELTRRQPDNLRHWWEHIQLLKAAHMESECLAAAREALRHNPPDDLRLELEYQVLEQLIVMGDVAGAWQQVAFLKGLEGESVRLDTKKIDLYRMEGQTDTALEAVTKLFPKVQGLPVAHLTRGAIYLDMGRYAEAKADLERVVALQPFDERAHFKLAEACRALGQEDLAQRHRDISAGIREKRVRINNLVEQQQKDPQQPPVLEELSRLHRELGESQYARYWEQRAALARNPSRRSP